MAGRHGAGRGLAASGVTAGRSESQCHLPTAAWRAEEGRRGRGQAALMDTMALAGQREAIAQQLCPGAGAHHPAAESRIVLAPTPRIPQQRHDVLGAIGQMLLEPLAEDLPELVRQTQQYVPG